MKQEFLKVSKLCQSYNGHDVFNDFKFSLSKGESILLQGENGSGKTTILKILSGLLEPDSGKFIFDNKSPVDYKTARNKLLQQSIYLHQQPFLFDTSVENNLSYASKSETALSDQQQTEVIILFGIDHLLGKNATNLSIGQKQRVALARSLIFNPRLLMLDEPFTAIDKESFISSVQALQQYRNKGGTILLVSHQHDRSFDLIEKCWCIHPRGVLFCVSAA